MTWIDTSAVTYLTPRAESGVPPVLVWISRLSAPAVNYRTPRDESGVPRVLAWIPRLRCLVDGEPEPVNRFDRVAG